MSKGKLEIGVYEPPISVESDRAARNTGTLYNPFDLVSTARSRYVAAALGALASLLLHTLLITALAWGGGHSRTPSPQEPDPGALGRAESEDGEAMQLVSIEEPASQLSSLDPNTSFSPKLVPLKLDVPVVPPTIPSLQDESTATDSPVESAEAAALFGRYMGQINARIERAWRRPRDAVKGGMFSCRARIEQDPTGVVREITLENCNGNSRWQLSLVQAIQLASPLPAPPDPKVFKRLVRLDFRALPYSSDAPADLYERPVLAETASHR